MYKDPQLRTEKRANPLQNTNQWAFYEGKTVLSSVFSLGIDIALY